LGDFVDVPFTLLGLSGDFGDLGPFALVPFGSLTDFGVLTLGVDVPFGVFGDLRDLGDLTLSCKIWKERRA